MPATRSSPAVSASTLSTSSVGLTWVFSSGVRRPKVSRPRTTERAETSASFMSDTWGCSSGGALSSSMSVVPTSTVSGLFSSCATPATSSPRAESLAASSICCWASVSRSFWSSTTSCSFCAASRASWNSRALSTA